MENQSIRSTKESKNEDIIFKKETAASFCDKMLGLWNMDSVTQADITAGQLLYGYVTLSPCYYIEL